MVLILTTHFDSANGTVVVMSAQQHGITSHHRPGLWKDAHMTQQNGQDKSKRTKCRTAKTKRMDMAFPVMVMVIFIPRWQKDNMASWSSKQGKTFIQSLSTQPEPNRNAK